MDGWMDGWEMQVGMKGELIDEWIGDVGGGL